MTITLSILFLSSISSFFDAWKWKKNHMDYATFMIIYFVTLCHHFLSRPSLKIALSFLQWKFHPKLVGAGQSLCDRFVPIPVADWSIRIRSRLLLVISQPSRVPIGWPGGCERTYAGISGVCDLSRDGSSIQCCRNVRRDKTVSS